MAEGRCLGCGATDPKDRREVHASIVVDGGVRGGIRPCHNSFHDQEVIDPADDLKDVPTWVLCQALAHRAIVARSHVASGANRFVYYFEFEGGIDPDDKAKANQYTADMLVEEGVLQKLTARDTIEDHGGVGSGVQFEEDLVDAGDVVYRVVTE